jgi:peptidoglycan/LPS O-acetylase OafA/YrhL
MLAIELALIWIFVGGMVCYWRFRRQKSKVPLRAVPLLVLGWPLVAAFPFEFLDEDD